MNAGLVAENAELRARLAEAEETLEAIRTGAVDALVAAGPQGEQVFTLQGAETPYRLLMESMNEGAATLSPDGTILYCNRRFAEMTGIPAEQIVGSCLCQRVLPAQQAAVRELVASALGAGAKAEFILNGPGGPGLPVLLSLRPIQHDAESIAVVATDLSERKQYEGSLHHLNQELEERVRLRTAELQAIFDTAPIGLAIAEDPEGRHIRGNPAIEQALGLPRGGELSRTASRPAAYRCLQDGRELPVEQLPMQRAARGETVTGHLMDILRPDGQVITLYSNAAPLLNNQGRPARRGWRLSGHHCAQAGRGRPARERAAAPARPADRENVGSWEWDIATGALLWSEQIYRQMGEESGRFKPSLDGFLERVHPEDRTRFQTALERGDGGSVAFRGGVPRRPGRRRRSRVPLARGGGAGRGRKRAAHGRSFPRHHRAQGSRARNL